MLIVNAPADISEWIRKYKVSPSVLTDNENEIEMYFPLNNQDLIAELSGLDFGSNGYSRTLKVSLAKTNGQAGNCILTAYFEFGFLKDARLAKAIIVPDLFWENHKNSFYFASQIIKAAKLMTAISNNRIATKLFNITVYNDNYNEENDEFKKAWDQLMRDNLMEEFNGESDFDVID